MLQDDAGDLFPVKLDPDLVNSENAIIVLDEFSDTCFVFVGKSVNMPTRMHALRMGKSVQKSGFTVGVTTIGRSSGRLVEMLEKDDSDPDVAAAIQEFRNTIDGQWNFDDKFLAHREVVASEPIAGAPAPKPAVKPEPVVAEPVVETPTLHAETVAEPPVAAPLSGLAEKKAAFLLLSAIKHSDLIYTERFERDGKMGIKIEAPGTMVIEALLDGDKIHVEPAGFGDSEIAKKVKSEFESWLKKM